MAYDLGKIPAQVRPHKTYRQYLDEGRWRRSCERSTSRHFDDIG